MVEKTMCSKQVHISGRCNKVTSVVLSTLNWLVLSEVIQQAM